MLAGCPHPSFVHHEAWAILTLISPPSRSQQPRSSRRQLGGATMYWMTGQHLFREVLVLTDTVLPVHLPFLSGLASMLLSWSTMGLRGACWRPLRPPARDHFARMRASSTSSVS